jgi:hypothetical protein
VPYGSPPQVAQSVLSCSLQTRCIGVLSNDLNKLHEASEWKLSGENGAKLAYTSWSVHEGQLLHDLVAYLHKLRRRTEGSACKYVNELKALCPAPADAPTRKRKSPSGAAEDRPALGFRNISPRRTKKLNPRPLILATPRPYTCLLVCIRPSSLHPLHFASPIEFE